MDGSTVTSSSTSAAFATPDARAGFDYFENSRRETYANRAYCAETDALERLLEPHLGTDRLRRTGELPTSVQGRAAIFMAIRRGGRWVNRTDGRRHPSPSAALGSLPFAPEIVIPAPKRCCRHGTRIFGRYGFATASIRASATTDEARNRLRRSAIRLGREDYLGIDQGPILLQAANYRDDFVWRYMRRVPAIRLGLKRAGFTGGWLG